MLTFAELAAIDRSRPPVGIDLGMPDLHEVTGGLRPGRPWIVTGRPGQGVSTLLTQWAGRCALLGHETHLYMADELPVVRSRLLAAVSRVAVDKLDLPSDDDRERLARATEELSNSGLRVEHYAIPPPDDGRESRVVLVDRLDRFGACGPRSLRTLVVRGAHVLGGVPRHLIVDVDGPEPDLDPAWADLADVVVDVRHRGLLNAAERPGEAELQLLRNRHGPCATLIVAWQPQYARFAHFERG